jgi:hypothetical protein
MARHVITLFKEQKSRSSTYLGHGCSEYIFYCIEPTVPCGYTGGVRDLKVGDHSCGWGCSTQNICLKPDIAEAYIGKSSRGLDPLISILWDVQPPNLRCVYDLDRIDTVSQINTLKRLFPNEQVNHIMRAFCTQKSTKCPDSRSECSKLKSLDESGSICREWLSNLPSEEARDSVRREYCIHNNTEDCKCINRTKYADYTSIENGMFPQLSSSSRCWYKPCEDNSNLLLEMEQKQECIANVCQTIIEAHAQGNININNNTSSLNCSFTKQQLTDANAERDAKLNPQPPKPSQPTTSFSIWEFVSKYKIIIAIIPILFLIIISLKRN